MTDVEVRDDGSIMLPIDATPEERIAFAHRMRLMGKSWREISQLASYASDDVARLQVRAWLQKAAMELDQTMP